MILEELEWTDVLRVRKVRAHFRGVNILTDISLDMQSISRNFKGSERLAEHLSSSFNPNRLHSSNSTPGASYTNLTS